MYTIYKEDLSFIGVYKETKALSKVLKVSVSTIQRHKKEKRWEVNGYVVLFPTFVQGKSARGGNNNPNFGGNMW